MLTIVLVFVQSWWWLDVHENPQRVLATLSILGQTEHAPFSLLPSVHVQVHVAAMLAVCWPFDVGL